MIDKTKAYIKLLQILVVVILTFSCQPTNNKISDYSKITEEFDISQNSGVVFDTIENNIYSHKIINGDNIVFVYKRTGITISDVNEYDAKYSETLIFHLDSTEKEFEYCDTALIDIDCRYFWICFSNEPKKVIRKINNGCIKGKFEGDSLFVEINIDSEYSFGSFLEKSKTRKINYSSKTIIPD